MEPVLVFAPLDPRTDTLAQLIWGLARQRQMQVVEAHVVVDRHGKGYLEREFLAPGEVLDQLRARLGAELLDQEHVRAHRAELPDGSLAFDEALPAHGEAYLAAMWRAGRAAIAAAGPRRVVFALLSVRRRSMSAMLASFFQLLGRKQDLLLDVRLSDRRAEAQGDFFFPEQEDPVLFQQTSIDPRRVEVRLVELPLPRLGGLLGPASLSSYGSALATSQRAIDALTPPRLDLDLAQGTAAVDGRSLPLSAAELLWYAFLLLGRQDAEGWVPVGQESHGVLAAFLRKHAGRPWLIKNRTRPLLLLEAGEYVPDEDLRNLRAKTVQKLKAWCAAHHPGAARWLVPEWSADGGRFQRVLLPDLCLHLKR